MRASAFPAKIRKPSHPGRSDALYLYLMGRDSQGQSGKTFVAQPK